MKKSYSKNIFEEIKTFWNWMWKSDSIFSYLILFIFLYLTIKFIFFPTLSLILNTELPAAIVESSSMDHQITLNEQELMTLCGKIYTKKEKMNFDGFWENCGEWYLEKTNITKEQFSKFSFQNGFKKGDLIIIYGKKQNKIGDVVVFKPNKESSAPNPIIHRIISLEPIQTKGDHNPGQLSLDNNLYKTDETSIEKQQIIGTAVFKIPYVGWLKLGIIEFFNKIMR